MKKSLRSKTLHVKLTSEEHSKLKELSEKLNKTVSSIVLDMIYTKIQI